MIVKDLNEFSRREREEMVLDGMSFAMFCANKDKKKYKEYRQNPSMELKEYEKRNMDILSVLDGLGYPMDELGTYLYKDVIADIMDLLIDYQDDMGKYKELMHYLQNPYSNFYRWIAREDKEMGIASFHLLIEEAIKKIDPEHTNRELATKVFGSNTDDLNYGLHAFQLAAYCSDLYCKETDKLERPIIKSLSNEHLNVN